MSNKQKCCALEICCPPPMAGPNSKAITALAQMLANGSEEAASLPNAFVPDEVHLGHARTVMENFDLAPKGSLAPIKAALSAHFIKAAKG